MSLQSGDCDSPNRGCWSEVASDTPMILDTYERIRYELVVMLLTLIVL
jgi:hypothetical protein